MNARTPSVKIPLNPRPVLFMAVGERDTTPVENHVTLITFAANRGYGDNASMVVVTDFDSRFTHCA